MFPYNDAFQFILENNLSKCFQNLKKDLENYIKLKFENHNPETAFPIIEIDIIYREDKHSILFLDKYKCLKYYGFKRDRTRHLLKILENTLDWINLKNLNFVLPKRDFKIYFDVSDCFYNDSEGYPIFVQSRPKNLNIPLYPDHTYFRMEFENGKSYDWDQIKEIFREKREIKPPVKKIKFFRGVDSTSNPYGGDNSNIRGLLGELSMKDSDVFIKVFSATEIKRKTVPLYNDCGYEIYLDLPGNFPWSYRKKFLYLTGGDVVQVQSFWESDDMKESFSNPWVQFIDLILSNCSVTTLNFIYLLREDNRDNIIDLYNKIKLVSPLEPDIIKKRLERIEMLNMDRLYQYLTKMLILSSSI